MLLVAANTRSKDDDVVAVTHLSQVEQSCCGEGLPMKLETALVVKDSEEHEYLFQAFLDGSLVRRPALNPLGGVHTVDLKVWQVEHAGSKTRFGFKRA